MLLAIDAGNTNVVFGLWDGEEWVQVWRRSTDAEHTEDELASWLYGLFSIQKLPFAADEIVYASVVPALDSAIHALGEKWFNRKVFQLHASQPHGLKVTYEPPTAVGADRIANALGALICCKPPLIVVDFGTATTFDTIDREGTYVGGAILPGPLVAAQALTGKAAKLPQISLNAPPSALGRTTVTSLQSGLVLGYADAIEGLCKRISSELEGSVTILATGGLAALYMPHCPSISIYKPNLTLDGLVVAYRRALQSGNW